MIDPYQPIVSDFIEAFERVEQGKNLPADVQVSLMLRLTMMALVRLDSLAGPATAYSMVEGLLLGFRDHHAHDCGDPLCPLNRPKRQTN